MAGLTIHVDQALADRLKPFADAAGESVVEYATRILDQALDAELADDLERLADYDRTGEFVSREEWMAGLRDEVLAKRTA